MAGRGGILATFAHCKTLDERRWCRSPLSWSKRYLFFPVIRCFDSILESCLLFCSAVLCHFTVSVERPVFVVVCLGFRFY
jgi:hypothetical protein